MIERKVKSIRALERGLDVLLEVQRSGGMSLHELHLQLGLPKATLLRLLVTLASRGLVWQRLADGAYLPSALKLSGSREDLAARLAEIASPFMVELNDRLIWPSVIAVPRLDHLEIIETNSRLARFDSLIPSPVGMKLSYIHTATGRAYLSACDAQERAAILERLAPADARAEDRALLDNIVAEADRRGYATRDPHHPWQDRNKQAVLADGKLSIAVPVRAAGVAVAAINVAWPGQRVTLEDVVSRHLETLKSIAEKIGQNLEAA
ncbi:MAG: helix-turn-helix domain-containing protein [Chakrabartia sp.]